MMSNAYRVHCESLMATGEGAGEKEGQNSDRKTPKDTAVSHESRVTLRAVAAGSSRW